MFPRLSPRQMRWSGWILLAGSILLIIVNYLVLSTPVSSSGLPSIPLSALEMIGGLLVFIGLPATYLRQRKEVGTLGLIGFILFWVSSLLVTVVLSGYAIFYAATTPPPAPGRSPGSGRCGAAKQAAGHRESHRASKRSGRCPSSPQALSPGLGRKSR